MRAWCLLALVACAGPPVGDPPPPESDAIGQSLARGTWSVAGHTLTADPAGLSLDGRRLCTELLGDPAVAGSRAVFAERRDGAVQLRALDVTDGRVRTLADAGDPGRAALSPDGALVAYVAAVGGVPSVFVVPFDGGSSVQLTNVGVVRDGAGPPEGFVPPPHAGPLAFDGDRVVWTAPDGPHAVEVPR